MHIQIVLINRFRFFYCARVLVIQLAYTPRLGVNYSDVKIELKHSYLFSFWERTVCLPKYQLPCILSGKGLLELGDQGVRIEQSQLSSCVWMEATSFQLLLIHFSSSFYLREPSIIHGCRTVQKEDHPNCEHYKHCTLTFTVLANCMMSCL